MRAAGRDLVADGRARTFLALPPQGSRAETVSIVVPVRHAVHHGRDGHITDVHAWARDLSSGGSLAQLADLGEAAGGRSITWLVDPAVPDAVSQLVAGNAVFATWDEVELMEIPMTTPMGTADAERLGVHPKPMRSVLGVG